MRHRKPRELPAPLSSARDAAQRLQRLGGGSRGRRQRRRPLAPAVLLVAPGVALGALALSPQAVAGDDLTGGGATDATDTGALADLVQTGDLAGIPLDRPALSGRKLVTVRAPRGALDSTTATATRVVPPPAPPKPRLPARASRSLSRAGAAVAAAEPERPEGREAARAPRTGGDWTRPAVGRFTSGYGFRWGRMHRGIDIAAPYGSPIYAAGAGTVEFAGRASGYGRLVIIDHGDGYRTAYGHMSKILVSEGERVEEGELIARVGNEGFSTGNHLHFEVRTSDGWVNPRSWLAKRGVDI